jgi:hypothetical protein
MLNTLQHPTCCPFGGSLIAHLTARSFTTRPVVLFVRWNATELPRSGEAFASPAGLCIVIAVSGASSKDRRVIVAIRATWRPWADLPRGQRR